MTTYPLHLYHWRVRDPSSHNPRHVFTTRHRMTEEEARARYEVVERVEQGALTIRGPHVEGPSRIPAGHGTPTPIINIGPRMTNLQSDDIPEIDFDL